MTLPTSNNPASESTRRTDIAGDANKSGRCLNCGHLLPAAACYCPECGQETRLRPPTVVDFIKEFAGNYFAFEGSLWRTLKLLLFFPGMLTRRYLDGQRSHYVRPLRLYLSISLLALLSINALFNARVVNAPPVLLNVSESSLTVIDFGLIRAGLNRGEFFCEGLPEGLCNRLQQRLNTDAAGLWQQVTSSGQRLISNLGSAMFVLVPVFALMLQLFYGDQRARYAEHLVFALHLHCVFFLAMCLTVLAIPIIGQFIWLAVAVYTWMAVRRVYSCRWWSMALRLAGMFVLYAVLLVMALSVLALWVMIY
ncbi:MAG: DUF3667 domain-containing protein [Pseudohongiella sp.]|nr:DUF3667 domain-containing protein [Pseudohongiella sp.]MDP2284828.1 DUF3667 domain-containing protein [Pseudohongiella sp.]